MPCSNCGAVLPFEEWLASIIKVDTNGNYGINLVTIAISDCTDLSDAQSCGAPENVYELLQKICSVDACGNMQINVFNNTDQ